MDNCPNVILVVFDTLRSDSIIGNNGIVNIPNISKVIRDGNLYENGISPSPWTTPSHASLFTGVYPSDHNVHETANKKDLDIRSNKVIFKTESLVKTLQKKGYNTIGFSANPNISPMSGFDIGFNAFFEERYNYLDPQDLSSLDTYTQGDISFFKIMNGILSSEGLRSLRLASKMRKQMRSNGWPIKKGGDQIIAKLTSMSLEQPFFLFMNFMEMHDPYHGCMKYWPFFTIPKLHTLGIDYERARRALNRHYLDGLVFLDSYIGSLVRFLKNSDIYDRSMIVLTSDHGQALGENDFLGHGVYLFDELIRIPIIVKFPNNLKFSHSVGYQSLTNVFKQVEYTVDGGRDDIHLTSDIAFAESFGYPNAIPAEGIGKKLERDNILTYAEKQRKAIFKGGYKLVVNGNDATIEEFTYQGLKVVPSERRVVLEELVDDMRVFVGRDRSFTLPE